MLKKFLWILLSIVVMGGVLTSCNDDSSSTEPSNEAPIVSIDSPTDGSSFAIGETVSIEITATDNDGTVENVDLYVNETMVTSLTSSPFNYDWNTADFEEGTYSLKVVAKDNGDLTTESNEVAVTLTPSNEAPVVSIDSPTDGSSFAIGETVSIGITATDNDGTVDQVDLYVNETMVTSLTSSPFNYDWNTADFEEGSYSLKAIATDNDGESTESSMVNITLIVPNEAPVVFIDSPANGTTFAVGSMVSFEINATDNDGMVEKVDLYLNDEMVTSFTNLPFNYNWDTANAEEGEYIFKAIATDDDGESTESSEVSINLIVVDDKMAFVQGGTFLMGDHFNEGEAHELPVHEVSVNSFLMSKYEVTQQSYTELIGYNPANGWGVGDNRPVYYVTWFDALNYCNKLSEVEGLEKVYTISGTTVTVDFTKNGYRLPTEAEWEYAARGGIYNGDDYRYAGCHEIDDLSDYCWYNGNTSGGCSEVGTKLPNQLGIYDMSGNVWEWCWDRYDPNYYSNSPSDNPTGPETGNFCVLRSGSWLSFPKFQTVAYRNWISPNEVLSHTGFRVARTVK
ncbi:MAG: hypothetical protein CR982_06500 [Candidatus Cloacimonadota bacterium]|nr:MAG: hypothetical protein CR982_06500 [Candidatus Cloacimonadota bacterium]PIE79939.1 MAG: hypothetical protein CSA15_02420 [Candidatus Delongbacteria bacterium]